MSSVKFVGLFQRTVKQWNIKSSFSIDNVSRRCMSAQPKITTHYSIVPRETDKRWKGKIYCLLLLICLRFVSSKANINE